MPQIQNFLIVVNSGPDKPYNHYAAYVVAFLAKKIGNIPNVSIYYGPYAVAMTRKGELAKLHLDSKLKELVAGQIEGLSAADLPDTLEALARFEKTQLGVGLFSCATFHVVDGIGSDLDDISGIDDFIVPLKLPQVAASLLQADKIHYL